MKDRTLRITNQPSVSYERLFAFLCVLYYYKPHLYRFFIPFGASIINWQANHIFEIDVKQPQFNNRPLKLKSVSVACPEIHVVFSF